MKRRLNSVIRLFPFFLVLIAMLGCEHPSSKRKVVEADTTQIIPEPTLLYTLPIDSFDVFEGKIKWNQNLSEILSRFNVSGEKINKVAFASKSVFDVRKLKANYPYTIIHEKDSLKTARQFVFEPDPTQFVIFHLLDSPYVELIERPVKTIRKELAAEITSSLYQSILDKGATPLLVNQLVDVFAWQVDFFRINKGDYFKVIYEAEEINGKTIGIKSIEGAYFNHFNKEFYAVHYDHSGKEDYFDEEGNSMRKTLLRAPLNYSRISSRYSPRRFHPVQKRYKAHLGTDYAAPTGTPIRSVGDGEVLAATYGHANGNYVKIKHNSNYTTQYLHMSKIARGIRKGSHVRQGQTIGYVGSTGLANGPHLCYRFWKNGRQVDALKVDLPPSEPIDPSKLDDFLHVKNMMVHELSLLDHRKQPIKVESPLVGASEY